MKHNRLIRLVLAALFAALGCVATMVISIPIPATNGYINLGDGIVLLGAFFLPPAYAAAAGGLGSMLADILLGYASYAPATLLIKALSALCAATVSHMGQRKTGAVILGAVAGEILMILGYFGYEALVLGYGLAAVGSIPANALQAAAGIVVSVLCHRALRAVLSIEKLSC